MGSDCDCDRLITSVHIYLCKGISFFFFFIFMRQALTSGDLYTDIILDLYCKLFKIYKPYFFFMPGELQEN